MGSEGGQAQKKAPANLMAELKDAVKIGTPMYPEVAKPNIPASLAELKLPEKYAANVAPTLKKMLG